MLLAKDINRKFTVPVGLVVDWCAGMISVAKTYMQLPQHRWFVGFDLDSECVASNLQQVPLDFARQILIMNTYIKRYEDVQ